MAYKIKVFYCILLHSGFFCVTSTIQILHHMALIVLVIWECTVLQKGDNTL